ncbi:PspC domain-containing protein [Flavivirga rizhaonensis]|uniref:PspC domain-containing protein n=1 Tax=Flavivirga rizhaonensis TaxID=2559571 RepID=A0A4S1DRP0_9FLAO|nr:PspC domain-containing protein [Flavivirga rizhaonensis]TGV00606.1 PspC domain-containing protein [Flavivirga rizhaonensis]
MNKTVNINLAGIFFHIDEDAYLKLQRYLEAIKRSFTDSQGRSEIISDIEARIAELFNERVQNNKEVIRIKEVDEVISIMGQPEDYLVDDEIFEDEPQSSHKHKTSRPKKLFRDTDNSYISGVSSGLAHYFGIDVIWIRLAWIILILGAGTGIFLYILLWVLVPEAKTTAEKIMMTGEPVNISNIEKKIKDGFENVTDVAKNVTDSVGAAAKNVSDSVSNAAKNVDFTKQGNKIKSSSKTFFDTLGEVIMFFFKVFAKFIGIILIFTGAITIISLIIALFSLSVVNFIHIPDLDLVDVVNAGNTPVWLVSLFIFFTVGIPFFFLFYLGLKILVNNLKSIGNIAKFTLLGLWLISTIGLVVIGIRQASEHTIDESVIVKQELNITANDTLKVKMVDSDLYMINRHYRNSSFKVLNNENGEKTIYRSDIRVIVKSTTDSLAKISIDKSADASHYEKAIERAKNINYNYAFNRNELSLDSYLTTPVENKFSDQEVVIFIYLPVGSVVYFDSTTKSFLNHWNHSGNIVTPGDAGHYLQITDDGITCLDCPVEESNPIDIDIHDDESSLKLDNNGLEIKDEDVSIKVNGKGISGEDDTIEVKIDTDGINIKSKDDNNSSVKINNSDS